MHAQTPPPLAISPLLSGRFPPTGGGTVTKRRFPPWGVGGIAPQICNIVSQCKSASAPCKHFLWRLRRLVFPVLSGPSDRSPPWGGRVRKGGRLQKGGGGLVTLARAGSFVERMKVTSVPGGNKVVPPKSMSKYVTEIWMGNNSTGATVSTYKLQCAILWWLTK